MMQDIAIPQQYINKGIMPRNSYIASFMTKRANNTDTFVSVKEAALSKREVKEFIEEVERLLTQKSEELGISHPPKIKIDNKLSKRGMGGSYNFLINKISLCPEVLTEPELYKIYRITDGGTILSKNSITKFKPEIKKAKYIKDREPESYYRKYLHCKGIQKKPLTVEERKKYFVFDALHELYHAYQHDLMRRTEGIGYEKIVEADCNRIKPSIIKYAARKTAKQFWDKYKNEEGQIKADSEKGKQAYNYLYGTENYVNPKGYSDIPAYINNYLEYDANNYANTYIKKQYEEWT